MLSDAAIRRAKPQDKTYKLSDSGGLFLLIQPNGSRLWRLGGGRRWSSASRRS
ncbi:Arm DNA-binding domain-containing protein [Gluconacetobacter diazotrophicus]|uniref:Arm DNA-binding domain-containing protein n=1 Tax=Gluconacetobacter diazotrophicus TaxID=33996 RepID=UPI0038991CB7